MVNHNNQAGRLHKILTAAANQQDGIPTIQAWANVFNIDQQEKSSIFKMLVLLQESTDDIKNKILNLSGVNSELLLSQHGNIEHVVKATNLDAGWNSYKPLLNLAVMLSLAHCAEALSRYDEKPIEDDELTSLDTDIVELFNKVADGTIDPTLKEIILDLLEAIRRSISEYKIRGASGIRDQLAYCLGKAFYNKELFTNNTDSEEVVSWWKIFARTDNMTTVALNLVSIGTTVINLLAIAHK
jgi:hypothetical protein